MALWSVALFGHYKPKEEGWERRAEPGDIIAVRPYLERGRWTDTERRQFLIVTLDDFDDLQLGGLIEPQWDTDSYPIIPADILEKIKAMGEVINLYPQRNIKKRRFHLTLDDLRDMGVDIDRMLNKELFYSPDLNPIKKIKCHDKLHGRYAKTSDGFNLLAPKKIGKAD